MIKRFLLSLVLLLGIALPANATVARGVGPLYIATGSLSASHAGTLNGTTIGRSLVIVVMWYDPTGSINITTINIGGESDASKVAGSKLTNGAGGISVQIAYLANNTAGGNKLVTVNFDATTYADVAVMEYSGMDTASQPDNSGTATGVTTATTSYTTNNGNALIVVGGINNSADFTAGGAYTLFGSDGLGNSGMPNSLYYEEAEDLLDAGVAGSKTVDFTGFASNWDMSIVSFKAAGGGAAAPIRHKVANSE